MASTSSTPPDQWKTWDAFISFRGKDIRQGFLSHLFKALLGKQINAFLDENLEKGEEISSSLLETIEDSYVSVVVFSENYADSPWCLDELVKIFQCMKTSGQIVLPVFYRVDPTDVQELRGNFGEAFSKHKKEVKILEGWRHALIEISNLAGWDSRNIRELKMLKAYHLTCMSRGQLQLPSGLEFLPEGLRYLHWDRYPLNYLPLKSCTKYLVELHMPRSNLTDLWNGDEALGNLKFLDLSNSLELTRVPDLSSVPNLEVLRLSECRSLIEIPSSIGELKCLKELNLMGCSKLLSIPQSICNLKSLTLLSMSDCLNVTELPENIGDLQYLETLHILDSGIKALPSSINQLENLVSLKCKGCKGLTLPPLTGLSSLQEMELMYCGILEIPESLGFLVSLRSLFLIENNFESIPVSIKQLSKLKIFYLLGCKRLKCLPELPSCLEQLLVRCCTSLESASTSFLFPEQEDEDRIENILEFTDCINLDKEKVMENVLETHLLKHKIVRLCITGDEVPRRMRYKNQSGSSLSFTLDKPNLIGVSLCLVFDPKNHYGYHVRFICGAQFIDKSRHKIKIAKFSFRYAWMTNLLESEHVYLWNELFDMEDSFVEASFHFFIEHFSLKPQHNFEAIIKCGVLPIFRDDCLHRDKKRSRNQEDEEDEPYSLQRLKQGQKPCNSTTTTTESY
ncbi:disease resistance-like protein DSC1 isoform X2 [Hevea brasiliensis]|uniref:disease resistance-like protein DSC1 isoform X2 n=1 Tax=Hevea brasiliensis TaxID=3981 RepID=UPI0025D629D7|nr:disease resistance-like protein DSC1 isoform X2 [Hevea brasiliensis]XP_057990112.1 disease resistance-like protein DSC1 isoform X2 [Hevea brasiliensis]